MNININRNVTTADSRGTSSLPDFAKYTSSTLHDSNIDVQLGNSTLEVWNTRGVVSSHTSSMNEDSANDLERRDELEWHGIVHTPRVRNALRRLAAEAKRQTSRGETEEGGFAVE